eukprot:CAMPEP_0167747158 /NCGR_PEP_ID=MMETSP0110_2-20121227/4125_1 /TAXON_ID=629695 /ORGANISM="Gymnochlora sp., Strain CCMP2014" /LENGTH=295 /DNA_ID=CAMNT_0007632027 /DNA_START=635 /DNA_END=1519 /DNA_ORIENTATION=+
MTISCIDDPSLVLGVSKIPKKTKIGICKQTCRGLILVKAEDMENRLQFMGIENFGKSRIHLFMNLRIFMNRMDIWFNQRLGYHSCASEERLGGLWKICFERELDESINKAAKHYREINKKLGRRIGNSSNKLLEEKKRLKELSAEDKDIISRALFDLYNELALLTSFRKIAIEDDEDEDEDKQGEMLSLVHTWADKLSSLDSKPINGVFLHLRSPVEAVETLENIGGNLLDNNANTETIKNFLHHAQQFSRKLKVRLSQIEDRKERSTWTLLGWSEEGEKDKHNRLISRLDNFLI